MRNVPIPWSVGAILVMGLLMFAPARNSLATNPETLLMPGKLTTAHMKLEEDCTQCHDRSNRGRQRQLCMDCHKEVAGDVSAHRGFHGRLPGIDVSACSACHSEHRGRAADIVRFSRAQFDHRLSDFPLQGAHAALACESCHAAGKKYRAAKGTCVACHQTDEPHAGKLGAECQSCHEAASWRHIAFDHGTTRFALTGGHQQVPCAGCHFSNRYKGTPQQCAACHTPDDIHRGERGSNCGSCHTAIAWKTSKFDHARETRFALEGAHGRIACQACHRFGKLDTPLARDCQGCHREQDAHTGRFGGNCEQCHNSEQWRPATFDHGRDTHWPLAGAHARVDCHACHRPNAATLKLATDCIDCHRASDVHSGKLGAQCAQCHSPEGWRKSLQFDHDLTDFPLVGLHVVVPCEQCHVTRAFKDTGKECYSCHQADDKHHGSLGRECARCHSPNGWRIWEFDHGKETGFALAGAHRKLACANCHKQPPDKVKLGSDCASCHAQDDVHLGQYGRQCERCHSTATFKGARLH